jgi:transcriptional regulator with XRE-family HTH domain
MAHRTHGPEIARLRLDRGFTLQRLADEVGISRSHLGKIEIGERGGSAPVLKRIAIVLGVPVSQIAEFPLDRRQPWRSTKVGAA